MPTVAREIACACAYHPPATAGGTDTDALSSGHIQWQSAIVRASSSTL
jgi:hypothetical protein